MKIYFLVNLIVIYIHSVGSFRADNSAFVNKCENEAKSFSCEFYPDCLEKVYNCGQNGYPKGLGDKYCTRSIANMNKFEKLGQEWIRKVVVCVKEKIIDTITHPNNFDCKSLKVKALSIHPECYVNNGFCELIDYRNKNRFCNTINGLLNIFDIEDFKDPLLLKAVKKILKRCSEIQNLDIDKIAFYAESYCGVTVFNDLVNEF